MSRLAFLILFILVTSADLYQVWTAGPYRIVTKSLIMISLITYYVSVINRLDKSRPSIVFLIALVAALGGDIFLLWDSMFVAGLSSFLVMQIFYSYCFWKEGAPNRYASIYALLLLIIIGNAAYFLWPQLGALRIPVVIYMSAIAMMSYTAFCRARSSSGYWSVFLGTLLFIVSDTVLAVHQFSDEVNLGKLTVMATYALAQYFIVQGFIDGGLNHRS